MSEERAKLRLDLTTVEAVRREFEQNLRHGRAFVVVEEAPPVLSECLLVLSYQACELDLPAQVVMVEDAGSTQGVGLAIMPFDADTQARVAAFATTVEEDGERASIAPDTRAQPTPSVPAPEGAIAVADSDTPPGSATPTSMPPDEATGDEPPSAHTFSSVPPDRQAGEARHVRLRQLSLSEQQKIARTGDLSDRVAVERLYGKTVWASLLQNPKLTVPEVAKIARKGTVPRPLIDLILENKSWLKASPVRRALMSNPRTSSEGVMKILRMTPRHELKLIHRGTSYAAHVREQARKLLDL
ncbi:MAG: hypothetical protein OXU20_35670 [Myxococcales bacterium]|nr:hypothetical protein [Myxococcales bacterium]MDD9966346.1 hypothetical protein [Myxococcales bacterium]